jgi:hypothetical protein
VDMILSAHDLAGGLGLRFILLTIYFSPLIVAWACGYRGSDFRAGAVATWPGMSGSTKQKVRRPAFKRLRLPRLAKVLTHRVLRAIRPRLSDSPSKLAVRPSLGNPAHPRLSVGRVRLQGGCQTKGADFDRRRHLRRIRTCVCHPVRTMRLIPRFRR